MGINIWKLKLQTGLALASVLEGKPWAECQDAAAPRLKGPPSSGRCAM